MDFTRTSAQDELGGLSRQILTDRVTPEQLREIERSGTGFDGALWSELAKAGILSAALPEAAGGVGLGLLEQCSVLLEVGRTVAPVPYLPTIVLGASALAEFGTAEQRQRWAEPAGRGEAILTAALAEDGSEDPRRPASTAYESDGG